MNEQVMLIHGLARTSRSFNKLAAILKKQGYIVHNMDYASTRLTIEQAAEDVFKRALPQLDSSAPLHIVTHSLGGILTRFYLSRHSIANLGRVVMLAPPNHGSEVVDRLGRFRLFHWLNGPAGDQLGTSATSMPALLPAADYPLGIIAGNRSINCLLSLCLPTPNDGKVSVVSTQQAGMQDHLVVNASHPFIINHPHTIHAVGAFLQTGQFSATIHRCYNKRFSLKRSFFMAKVATARHILVDSKEICQELKREIEQGADFAAIAKEHSSCPSGRSGGDLGEFGPGMMVPEFDKVVFSAPLNTVQGPVQTQFGYHLLEVTSRTE